MKNNRLNNDQKLRKIITTLHPVELALLVERIQTMMHMTLKGIEANPSGYDNPIVSHHVYVNMANSVLSIIEQDYTKKDLTNI